MMTSQTLRSIFDQPLKQWLTKIKKGKTDIQKIAYFENEKNFLDEIKNFLKGYPLARNKKLIKNSGHML